MGLVSCFLVHLRARKRKLFSPYQLLDNCQVTGGWGVGSPGCWSSLIHAAGSSAERAGRGWVGGLEKATSQMLSCPRKGTQIPCRALLKKKIGLPHTLRGNVLSFLSINILPPRLQINVPPFPIWDRRLKAQQICFTLRSFLERK